MYILHSFCSACVFGRLISKEGENLCRIVMLLSTEFATLRNVVLRFAQLRGIGQSMDTFGLLGERSWANRDGAKVWVYVAAGK